MRGTLEVITGPMFAGKTTEIIKRLLWSKHQGKSTIIYKPAMDDRYSETEIVTHTKFSYEATSIIDSFNINPTYDHYFFDEIQFHDKNIVPSITKLLDEGKNVTVAGLDADYKGVAFANTATLMAMADEVFKIKSHCSLCGKDAAKTFKTGSTSDQRIELGENDLYRARCNEHWYVSGTDDSFS